MFDNDSVHIIPGESLFLPCLYRLLDIITKSDMLAFAPTVALSKRNLLQKFLPNWPVFAILIFPSIREFNLQPLIGGVFGTAPPELTDSKYRSDMDGLISFLLQRATAKEESTYL